MPMSPRLKSRRGRFGASGLSGPTLAIFGPGGILAFGPGSPTTIGNFTGVSSDDLDGNLSGDIVWHVNGVGSPSTGLQSGSPDRGVVEPGASANLAANLVTGSPAFGPATFTVVATVTDGGGARATRNLTVVVASAVDYVPNLTFVSPASGTVFGPGSPGVAEGARPNFVGTAVDEEDGNISANIQWRVSGFGSPTGAIGSPALATGASVDLSAFMTNVGSPFGSPKPGVGSPGGSPAVRDYTVFARVTDSGGNRRTESATFKVKQ